jgi:sugar phosphate isomerase/epimerase
MIIGAMNDPKKPVARQVELFGEMGFDFFELTVEAPLATPEKLSESRKEILDALHSYNFGVLSHCPWYFSVAHPYERVQKAIEEEFGRVFEEAARFGAKKVTMHTEWMPPGIQERQVMVAKTIDAVGRLHKKAEQQGLELLVENFNYPSFSIKEFKLLFSQVEAGMTLDVGHASTASGEGLENYLQQFKKKVKHVHLHDNNRKEDQHLPLGAGKIDIPHAVKELRSFYDGTITLEVHSEDMDYLRMSREKLEILWYGRKKHEENQEYLHPGQKKK